ncbi:MAG TPA: hypothetical protein VIM04_10380, partial [Candidatus Binatia bacterium]
GAYCFFRNLKGSLENLPRLYTFFRQKKIGNINIISPCTEWRKGGRHDESGIANPGSELLIDPTGHSSRTPMG